MLQRDPRLLAHHARQRLTRWWRRGPSRLRLRRRLVVYSIPVALLLLTGLGTIVSAMLAGDAAVSDFARHDVDGLRADVSVLKGLNVIAPGQVSYAAGDLAALEKDLDSADRQFTAALGQGADRCAVSVNLELVRETQGDLATPNADTSRAVERYNSALQVVSGAPPRCFQGNADPDPDRRRVREDAAARLTAKIKALRERPPPPPPAPAAPPPLAPPPPPAPAPVVGSGGPQGGPGALTDVSPDRIPVSGGGPLPSHRLGTGDGDPMDRLQDTLGDADSTGPSGPDVATGSHS